MVSDRRTWCQSMFGIVVGRLSCLPFGSAQGPEPARREPARGELVEPVEPVERARQTPYTKPQETGPLASQLNIHSFPKRSMRLPQ